MLRITKWYFSDLLLPTYFQELLTGIFGSICSFFNALHQKNVNTKILTVIDSTHILWTINNFWVCISNGYSRKLVDRTIKDSGKVELKKRVYVSLNDEGILAHEETKEKLVYFKTFNAPYVPGFSERLAKDMKIINVGMTFCKGWT